MLQLTRLEAEHLKEVLEDAEWQLHDSNSDEATLALETINGILLQDDKQFEQRLLDD